MSSQDKIALAAKQTLRDASRVLVFDQKDTVLYSTFEVSDRSTVQPVQDLNFGSSRDLAFELLLFARATQEWNFVRQVSTRELAPLKTILEDRDNAIRSGLNVSGRRYEVGDHSVELQETVVCTA